MRRHPCHGFLLLPLVFCCRAKVANSSSYSYAPSTFVSTPSSANRIRHRPNVLHHPHLYPTAAQWQSRNKGKIPIAIHLRSDDDESEIIPKRNGLLDSITSTFATFGPLEQKPRDEKDKIIDVDEQPADDDNNWTSKLGGSSSFTKYGRPKDINETSFGPLLPIAETVDEVTGGWGLSYADLHPATPRTTVGQAFLATNFFYAAAGVWLGLRGDWFYGGLTELAGIVSFVYHYTQLEFGKNRSEVRLALLIDYVCAGSALITGGVYMIQAGITSVPLDALFAAIASAICLSLCWVWEFGYPYIFWHSLWHILSAYCGFLVGQDHISKIAG